MASKLTLIDISSGFKGTDIQSNFTSIEDEFDDTLSRTGKSPNQMEARLDMNSFSIENLGTPSNNEGAARLKDVLDNADSLTSATAVTTTVDDTKGYYAGTNVEAVLEEIFEVYDPEHATDSGTDTYVSATNTTPPADGVKITRDFQSANTTTTPSLDGKTMTTRDGSALWAGVVSGPHDVQYDSGTDTYLVLEPIEKVTTLNILSFGADRDESSDTTPAFNSALSQARAGQRIYFPAGRYRFDSKPNDITKPVHIFGDGINATELVRNYNEAGARIGMFDLEATGVAGNVDSGTGPHHSSFEHFSILAESGTTGGAAIAMRSILGGALGWINLYNLRLSTRGMDTWGEFTLIIDGDLETTSGIRDIGLVDTWVFGAPNGVADIRSAQGCSWHGGGFFGAGGTSGNLNVDGTSSLDTIGFMAAVAGAGDLSLNRVEGSIFIGSYAGINNTTNASKCIVVGRVSGTVQDNWVNSSHIDPVTNAGIATGTYTGDGTTSQGITGIGFAPAYIKIWERATADTTAIDLFETTGGIVDDNASGGSILHLPTGGIQFRDDRVISLDSDGFTVDDDGSDSHPNKDGQVYNYMAIG